MHTWKGLFWISRYVTLSFVTTQHQHIFKYELKTQDFINIEVPIYMNITRSNISEGNCYCPISPFCAKIIYFVM